MNAIEIYERAQHRLEYGQISIGQFEEEVATLKDVEPVVRCKDCKHRGGYHCPMYHTETSLDDLDGFDDYNVDRTDSDGFCHRGERREQNESE